MLRPYDVLPVNRRRAIDFILREVKAARSDGLNPRLPVPLTRQHFRYLLRKPGPSEAP